MGPFGSDTRRYDMHCKCHSTSVCRFWGPFLKKNYLDVLICNDFVVDFVTFYAFVDSRIASFDVDSLSFNDVLWISGFLSNF